MVRSDDDDVRSDHDVVSDADDIGIHEETITVYAHVPPHLDVKSYVASERGIYYDALVQIVQEQFFQYVCPLLTSHDSGFIIFQTYISGTFQCFGELRISLLSVVNFLSCIDPLEEFVTENTFTHYRV